MSVANPAGLPSQRLRIVAGLVPPRPATGSRQLTVRCPRPGSARAGSQSHSDQEDDDLARSPAVSVLARGGMPTSAADPRCPQRLNT